MQINLGSSDSDSFTYDTNTDRMTQYKFSVNGQSVVGQLTWNPIGTLEDLVVTDPFYSGGNQSCMYTHDDLSRIASANCGSLWSQTFTYDPFGNIYKSGTGSFQPTYSYLTNHMTQIGSSTPTYDSNGNVTNDFLHTYAWDANGRPVTADGVGLTYDALGRMAEQNRSGVYTEIVYSPAGAKLALMTGQTLQKAFVPLTGSAVAVYNSSGLAYYRHSDWLGSSRFASTPTRSMYLDGAYAPFGESYAQTGTVDLSFTGMNQDTVSNLYDFPAREYGIQGRWPSPDPAGLVATDLTDPQTLNRYAYVRNSPVHFVDPQGLNLCEPAGCTGYGGGGGGDDGYCPPEYNYCGDDPFGDDGGDGILAGPPGSAPLPPNGIDWQNLLFGPNSGLANSYGEEEAPILLPLCVAQPEICLAIAITTGIVYVGAKVHEGVKNGTITLPSIPHIHFSRRATEQYNAAWARIVAICASRGVQLNDGHRDRWHDKKVTGKGLKSFADLVKAGVDAFCPATGGSE